MTVPALEGGIPVRQTLLPFSPPDIRNKEIDAVCKVLSKNDIAIYGVNRSRDYVHVSDAVRAFGWAIQHKGLRYMDVSSGNPIVTKDLAAKIKELTKYTGELKFLESELVPVYNSTVKTKPAELWGFTCEADFDTELKALIAKRKKDLKWRK